MDFKPALAILCDEVELLGFITPLLLAWTQSKSFLPMAAKVGRGYCSLELPLLLSSLISRSL